MNPPLTYSDDAIKILVTNLKGGVGKSTISANLAAYLALQEGLKVALVDFDRQASSSRWIKKAPDIGINVHQVEVSYQNTGVALLNARAGVRKHALGMQVCICDFTWTPAMSDDFISDFDIVLVPSSNTKFEIASTEIFILEYVQKRMARLAVNRQSILIVPSRVDPGYSSHGTFTNLDFLINCHITPPVYRASEIDGFVYEDFLCVCANPYIAGNFCTFGDYIKKKIDERRVAKINLSICGPSVNREIADKVSVLDDYRKRAKDVGFYGGAALAISEALPEKKDEEPTLQTMSERFIPSFLRKNRE
jgi:hypothetical protein